MVCSLCKSPDSCLHPGVPCSHHSSSQFLRPQVSSITFVSANKIPLLHLKHYMGTQWEYSSNLMGVYFDILHEIATYNMTLFVRWCSCHHHNFLLQLCHSQILPGSFQCFGSHSSALTVIPFNQGSKQDVEVLVDYIYMTLGLDLDYVIPLLLFLRMAMRLTVWMTSLSSCTISCL